MFSSLSKKTLLKAALFQNTPVYVQFYVTARCNLTCEQCNIIYANSDLEEVGLDDIKKIADNFSEMGVAIVLLTGGEPFVRKDLHLIIQVFEERGIHVRMQTNGLATEERIQQAIEYGGRDISISLDSLYSSKQDKINGDVNQSWHRALKAISNFSKYLPFEKSFASLGCVMQPYNIDDIENVIKFGTKISWYTSLVPAHVTSFTNPRGFRTFDKSLLFSKHEFKKADNLLDKVHNMREQGYLLYDSDQYLEDIKRFIRGHEIEWRKRNNNLCDSPNLYFAVLPNGHFAPCCDHRMVNNYPVFDKKFPQIYKESLFRKEVKEITSSCEGCMYGSYPEMSISMRFNMAKIQRIKNFMIPTPKKNWPLSYEDLLDISNSIIEQR